ncbi:MULTISPECIES: iron ABC transporter permease [Lacrimispora]|uniref:FecCD family ABC transporter permease n=1 Tax=Lacrimispora TaxID=2719231 RepID=UPI000BE2F9E4|nr:iron ABC transporter permease [Lacrimispora amygdalina]MDK2966718.1 iron-siderophore transport system permease protein [Lacrimispora sp.]
MRLFFKTINAKGASAPKRKLLVLLIILAAAYAACVCTGSLFLSPKTVFLGIFGMSDGRVKMILETIRLPRATTAVLAGAALGVSGALLQGTIRNPLAAPNVIGITGGGSLFAVLFLNFFPDGGTAFLSIASFSGALAAAALVYVLAFKKGVTPIRLILVGIGVSSVTSALTTLLLSKSKNAAADKAYLWMVGSVYGADWKDVRLLLTWFSICFLFSMTYARHIDVQGLGDEVAAGLGAHLQRHRAVIILLSAALSGGAAAVAGAIGFIGLIAPHMGRRLVGTEHAFLLPASALIGALILLISDTVARTVFLPVDVPAGVFTAAIGAPFFIYQLYCSRNQTN